MPKSILASRTFWLNFLAGVVAVLESQEWINVIPAGWGEEIALLVFVINIVLRYLTTQPVTLTVSSGGTK